MEGPFDKQIEQYLLGHLQGADLTAFEKQIKSDKKLAEEVKIQRVLMEQVESMGALELKKELLDIKKGLETKRRTIMRRMLGLTAAAAIALLVFGVQFMGTEIEPVDLYGQYYSAYELPFTSRSSEEEVLLGKAGVFYLSQDYKNALPVLEQVLESNPTDSRSRLALGISQMELNKETEALKTFAMLIDNQDALYLDQARWYTALLNLKQNNIDACRKQLILVTSNPRAPHLKEAQELLKQLEK